MYRLTNKLERRVGLPAKKRKGIILDIGASVDISNDDYDDLASFEKNQMLFELGAVVSEKLDAGKPEASEE